MPKKPEEIQKIIADFKNNPDNWERTNSVIKPGQGKKYNVGNLDTSDVKRKNFTVKPTSLSSLEHSILSTCTNGDEPLRSLWQDARHEFEEISFASFLESLARLFKLGYIEAHIEDSDKPETELTKEGLSKYYGGGLSEEEIETYPNVLEYYFKATPKGIKEEAREIYNVYYCDYL